MVLTFFGARINVLQDTPHKPLAKNAGEESVANLDKIRFSNGPKPAADIRLQMQKTMQNYAAVFRTGETLKKGKLE